MKTVIIALALLVTGCAANLPPSASELAAADHGPTPRDYKAIIEKHMAGLLKDPNSATYEYSMEPVKTWFSRAGVKQYGYGVCAHINAKNSYGGFTGQRKSYFFIRDDHVMEDRHAGESGSASEREVYNACSYL